MADTNFRKLLVERPCFGTFLKLPRHEVVDVLALAGYDFVIVDMEHGQITEKEARHVIQACRGAGLAAVVRLPDAGPGIVNRLLEAGAVGIQMPKVRTGDDSRRLLAMMRFPPHGMRSIGITNAWAKYGSVATDVVVKAADERGIAVGILETKDIESPIDGVVGPLDVAFIGPADLGVEFGLPIDHQEVQDRIRSIEEAARRTKTVLGYPAKSAQQALGLVSRGYHYIALSNDVAMLLGAARELIAAVKSATAP